MGQGQIIVVFTGRVRSSRRIELVYVLEPLRDEFTAGADPIQEVVLIVEVEVCGQKVLG